jgi:hypothetical protein
MGTAGIEILQPARVWPLNEVTRRFPLSKQDVGILREMWQLEDPTQPRPYPYAEDLLIATGS